MLSPRPRLVSPVSSLARASRLWLVLSLVAVVLAGFAATAGSRTSQAATIDKASRLHPFLQVGAQAEPAKKVTVIVTKSDKKLRNTDIAKTAGGTLKHDFPDIATFSMEVTQGKLSSLAKDTRVRSITPDRPVRTTSFPDPTGTTFENAIGVPQIWQSTSLPATGKGIGVAVLDSGINRNHASFSFDPTNVVEINTNARALGGGDGHGHGTHVSGIIKGRDSTGRYIGVAPGVKLVSVKIADETGAATESDLLNGLKWVYANRATHNIRVVNISVSSGTPMDYAVSPINAYVEQLWFAGITVVVSSGNRGPVADAAWYAPGNDPFVVTVGALDHNETVDPADDSIAAFSSRGISQRGHAKPEIVAPGRKIIAPLSNGGATIATKYPERIVEQTFIRMSGTSMSTPVVSGVVALLLEKFPTLTPNQVKWLLMSTANRYPGQPDGAGVIDPAEMFTRAAAGGVGSANAGLTPATGIDPVTNVVSTTQTYWDQTYWDQASGMD